MPLNTDRPAENAAEYGHLFNIVVQINLIISLVVWFNQNWLICKIKSQISCPKHLKTGLSSGDPTGTKNTRNWCVTCGHSFHITGRKALFLWNRFGSSNTAFSTRPDSHMCDFLLTGPWACLEDYRINKHTINALHRGYPTLEICVHMCAGMLYEHVAEGCKAEERMAVATHCNIGPILVSCPQTPKPVSPTSVTCMQV